MTQDAVAAFAATLAQRGISPAQIVADGKLHRCDADGARGKGDAAYVLHLDGMPAGGFINWRDGIGWQTWHGSAERQMSPAEQEAHRKRVAALKRAKASEERQRREAAQAQAVAIWERSGPAPPDHPYLERKGVQAHGIRFDGDRLVVPMRDAAGALHSLQFIDDAGMKRYLPGGRVSGCFFTIGAPNGKLLAAEGFATAATLHEATGHAAVVAFDAGNLPPVSAVVRALYPDIELVICADDDRAVRGNPGVTKARAAARDTHAEVKIPSFPLGAADNDTDFNDLARIAGIDAVREQIEARAPMANGEAHPLAGTEGVLDAYTPEPVAIHWPFQCLGYSHSSFFYLPQEGGQVIELTGAAHTKNNLMMLASVTFWEGYFGCKGREGWDSAANGLMREQYRVGPYDTGRLRGRGAWWDEGRAVVHLGDRLIVDGRECSLRTHETKFLYERSTPIHIGTSAPLISAQSARLLELCKMLNWEKPLSAYQLAGWCAIAPICGALKWRPNIFIAGGAGSGKSWVQQNILVPCLGGAGLSFASTVTEPGIRRSLGSDALAVMIDELEPRNAQDVARIESVFGLIRYSSSETSAVIAKGSQGGGGVDNYRIRSMFAISAIGSIIKDYADQTRNTTLNLVARAGRIGADKFAEIEAAQRALMTEIWIDGLHARIIGLIPVIRDNAETFASAGAEVLGTRRLGDQHGALFAGAYALVSNQRITRDRAATWIAEQDWTETRDQVIDTDGISCFARIMEHQVMIEGSSRSALRRTLGELWSLSRGKTSDDFIPTSVADATLNRHGLRPVADAIAVSNTHSAIKNILHDTPWPENWADRLKIIPGATRSQTLNFAGSRAKAILVPWPVDA